MEHIGEIIGIGVCIVLLVGVPAMMLWLRDRGGMAGWLIQRLIGTASMLIGLTLTGFLLYMAIVSAEPVHIIVALVVQLPISWMLVRYGWYSIFDGGAGIEEVPLDFDSLELRTSVRRAQETLAQFIESVRNHIDGAFIKFSFTTDADAIEHIWGYVHHYENGIFNVSLANDPYTQRAPVATRLDVPEEDVEDWQIVAPDGSIRGGFSMIAAFEYIENRGVKLTRTMRKQRDLLRNCGAGSVGSALPLS